jgi:hypothetical protein
MKAKRDYHGDSYSPEHRAWIAMLARCRKDPYYAGRGIRVCEPWLSYTCFLADMGRKPTPKHTLDRINNDGNYGPGNCRWATMKEQAQNRRLHKKLTPEHRANVGRAQLGRKLTAEHRANISSGKTGTKLSPEHKAAISAGLRRVKLIKSMGAADDASM